jgi:tetratricopeptide (TPR) repeat protein
VDNFCLLFFNKTNYLVIIKMISNMKMKLWLTMAFMGTAFASFAQGGAARTSAMTYLAEYKMDMKQVPKLEMAKTKIDIAADDEKTADDPKTWRYKAEIYSLIAKNDQTASKFKDAAVEAYDAAEKALSMEEAKAEVKGKPKSKIAKKGEYVRIFQEVTPALYNNATSAYNAKEWERAYTHFERLTQIPTRTAELDPRGKIKLTFTAPSTGAVIDMESNARLLGGLAAVYLEKPEDAEKMFTPGIKNKKFKEDDVKFAYSKLATAYYTAGKNDKAKAILKEARAQYPTNYDLLIAEINIALAEGRLAELEEELAQAVKADPENVELHFVMGNMYDELFRAKIDASDGAVSDEDAAKGKVFFDKAVDWYKKAIKLKTDHFNSLYSLGAVHVNYSNFFAVKIQNSEDLTDEARKELEASYDKYVDLGLEHLLNAEKVNGEDLGLIRALKEVYTRKSDEENYMKYSKKEKELMSKQ